MIVVFYSLAGLLAVLLVGTAFLRTNPARLAETLRISGPLLLAIAGGLLVITGRAGIGGMLLSGAAALYASNKVRRTAQKTPGKRSTVRTAVLEMELDHDTGGLRRAGSCRPLRGPNARRHVKGAADRTAAGTVFGFGEQAATGDLS